MKYQRRGDFARIIRELRQKHKYDYEIKWQRAHRPKYQDFYRELTDISLSMLG